MDQPITPRIDGDQVTFFYQGSTSPRLIADFNRWGRAEEPPLLAPQDSSTWTLQVTLPRDAYIEYLFQFDGEKALDPLNPHLIDDGVGGTNNFFFMPDARPPVYDLARPLAGTLSEGELEDPYFLVGGRRTVRFYSPPSQERVPLLVVWDGQDYVTRAGLVQQVDTLISDGRIAPIAMALVDHAGQGRIVEYYANDAVLHFLRSTLLPLAYRDFPVLATEDHPGFHGVMGASLGGLMALYAAIRMPETFGRVYSQSGAFGLTVDEVAINDLVRYLPPTSARIHLDWGRYEALRAPNLRMLELLRERGYDVTGHEFTGFHNFTSWAMALAKGLQALFPVR